MPTRKWCFVPQCKNTSYTAPDKTFVSVPKESQKRQKWFDAARRDIAEVSKKSTVYCCEDHFNLKEDMENYMEYTLSRVNARMKPNIVPHLFSCQGDNEFTAKRESSDKQSRKRKISVQIAEVSHAEEKVPLKKEKEDEPMKIIPSTSLCERKMDAAYQTRIVQISSKGTVVANKNKKEDGATSPIKFAMPETRTAEPTSAEISYSHVHQTSETSTTSGTYQAAKKNKQEEFGRMFMDRIEKRLSLYTGIPKDYLELIDILEKKTRLKKQNIYLVLYKIKTNEPFAKIADLFGLSKASACLIFSHDVLTIAEYMKKLIFWPSKDSIQRNLPIPFRMTFHRVQSIINCLEIEIQKPAVTLQQSSPLSDYKKCNTLKYLISVTPGGLINFISCGYEGSVSDAALLEDCGYLDVLPVNCVIMADRGFKQIQKLLNRKKCTLVRPPSVQSGLKMTEEDVTHAKTIARIRIHITRVIKRICEFKFLSAHDTVNSDLVQQIDKAIIIAGGIINIQKPINTQ